MESLKEVTAKRLYVSYLKKPDLIYRSIFFLQGMVFAKTGVLLRDSFVLETAKEVGRVTNEL